MVILFIGILIDRAIFLIFQIPCQSVNSVLQNQLPTISTAGLKTGGIIPQFTEFKSISRLCGDNFSNQLELD